jgi:hypothetical protein
MITETRDRVPMKAILLELSSNLNPLNNIVRVPVKCADAKPHSPAGYSGILGTVSRTVVSGGTSVYHGRVVLDVGGNRKTHRGGELVWGWRCDTANGALGSLKQILGIQIQTVCLSSNRAQHPR